MVVVGSGEWTAEGGGDHSTPANTDCSIGRSWSQDQDWGNQWFNASCYGGYNNTVCTVHG